jgi:hypothetical protein
MYPNVWFWKFSLHVRLIGYPDLTSDVHSMYSAEVQRILFHFINFIRF